MTFRGQPADLSSAISAMFKQLTREKEKCWHHVRVRSHHFLPPHSSDCAVIKSNTVSWIWDSAIFGQHWVKVADERCHSITYRCYLVLLLLLRGHDLSSPLLSSPLLSSPLLSSPLLSSPLPLQKLLKASLRVVHDYYKMMDNAHTLSHIWRNAVQISACSCLSCVCRWMGLIYMVVLCMFLCKLNLLCLFICKNSNLTNKRRIQSKKVSSQIPLALMNSRWSTNELDNELSHQHLFYPLIAP